MTRIKLCGFRRECDVDHANTLHPDYVGFIFAENRTRTISRETARSLKEHLDPSIQAVGVFINQEISFLVSLVEDGIIDVIQLHGTEDEEYIRTLRTKTDAKIIKAFRIETEEDLHVAEKSSADLILLDSGIGGTGTAFDWSLLRNVTRPFVLAGGLNPETIENALKTVSPYGVDVSSGIETDGNKDYNKMNRFVETVRSFDQTTTQEEQYE